MTIDCAFYGFLAADADARTSKAGKPFTRLRVGVGRDDDVQWVSVAVFGKTADAAATAPATNAPATTPATTNTKPTTTCRSEPPRRRE
jgi:hypothetical protein